MSQLKELLDQEAHRIDADPDALESTLRKRDHKRRNQRITAGVVGIAVFVAAVWIVRDVASLGRSETSVPAVSGTTGPAETGPTVTVPYDYDPTADFVGLAPEGAQPSGPESSDLVAKDEEIHVGWVYVFEDGRVIANAGWGEWPLPGVFPSEFSPSLRPDGTTEQRLTPEGVDLVRSGVIYASDFICPEKPPSLGGLAIGCQGPLHEIPPSAWEDSTLRPYVPYGYAICGSGPEERQLDRSLGVFPVAAQDLLRGKESADCFDVTTEDARRLDEILADAGFRIGDNPSSYQRWLAEGPDAGEPWMSFEPILPNGTIGQMHGG
jgi:hypothetical protein